MPVLEKLGMFYKIFFKFEGMKLLRITPNNLKIVRWYHMKVRNQGDKNDISSIFCIFLNINSFITLIKIACYSTLGN